MAKKIVTYISLPSAKSDNRDEPRECRYRYPEGDKRRSEENLIPGRQTNEAALKYFLSSYSFSPDGQDAILCLCTEEVQQKPLGWAWASADTLSYVRDTLEHFCAAMGKGCPPLHIIPIQSREADLELALSGIMGELRTGDEVYIDTSGGLRDANFIMLLLMQALEYKGCVTREMVCTYLPQGSGAPGEIRRLDAVSRIMHMTSAMAEFTTYGRARMFNSMKGMLDPASQNLVVSLQELSESLENSAFSTAGGNRNMNEILNQINDALLRCEQSGDLDPLMRQLLPVFREKMNFDRESGVTLSSITAWCAENHLVQQAATIFNENLLDYLSHRGILEVPMDGPDLQYAIPMCSVLLRQCARKVSGNPFQADSATVRRKLEEYLAAAGGADGSHVREQLLRTFRSGENGTTGNGSSHAERTVSLALRLLFTPDGLLRDRADAARMALEEGVPELLPIAAELPSPDAWTIQEQEDLAEPLRFLSQASVFQDLAGVAVSLRLRDWGFCAMMRQLVKDFQAERIPSRCSELDWKAQPRSIQYISPFVSFADTGLLLLYYHLIRMVRNNMNHSGAIYQGDDIRDAEYLKKYRLEEAVFSLDLKNIRIHLRAASACLGRLDRQNRAGRRLFP